jgi:hypothetical protein
MRGMTLPVLPKALARSGKGSDKRDKAVTFRLSQKAYKQLLELSERTGLSQASVVMLLLEQEHSALKSKSKK